MNRGDRRRRKREFCKELETTPIVSVACRKIGVSRNTIYRWRQKDKKFASKMEESRGIGIELVHDAAESNVLNGIKKEDPGYTKFWLSRRHSDYKKKPRIKKVYIQKEINDRSPEEIEEAARRMAEWMEMWMDPKRNGRKKRE